MIIEFTGMPGAGKSTIIRLISQKIPRTNVVTDIENYVTHLFYIRLPGTIGYDITLLFNFYRLKKIDYVLMLKSIKQLQVSNNSVQHKVNIFRNIFKKLVINRILLSKSACFIVDEGISHIPISLFVDIDTEIDMSRTEAYYDNLPQLNDVILVDACDKCLFERVVERGESGHARMDFSDRSKIESFMFKSRTVIELSKKKFNPKIYHNNCNKMDLEKIYDLIVSCDV